MVQILRSLAAIALLSSSLAAQNIHWGQILSGDRQGSGTKGMSNALTSAHFFIGNGSNVATDVALSGDASVTNAGVWTNVKLNGVSFAASPSTNTVPIVTASNTATYSTVPDCQDSTGNHLNYNNTTHALSCGTSSSGGMGSVTSVGTTSPITGGTITATGTIACATCVVASSPGAGIAHFAGSTQTVTSSSVVSADLNITTSSCTAPAVVTAISAGGVGTCTTIGLPQNSKSAAYTTVLGDAGGHIYHPSADTTARTWTIDSNANVAYPIGTTLTFVNDTSAGTLTIAITSDTLVFAGPGSTGSRTLAAGGIATALKVTSTRWIISGSGLT